MADPSVITSSNALASAFIFMPSPRRPQSVAEQSQSLSSTSSDQDDILKSIDDLSRITIQTNKECKECVRAQLLNQSQSHQF